MGAGTRSKRWMTGVLVALVVVLVVGCGPTPAPTAEPTAVPEVEPTEAPKAEATAVEREGALKVAYLPCGRITDQAWSQNGWEGVQKAMEMYDLDVSYTESPPVADIERIVDDYVAQGNELILLHCGTFADAGIAAGERYPDVQFCNASVDISNGSNVCTYDGLQQQGAFIAGTLAGQMTESNKLGVVAGFAFSSIVRQVEGFKLGARYVNPDVEVMEVYIDSWEDIAKGKEAAVAMIDSGADIIFTATDQASEGAFKAAEERGVYAIASFADQASKAPNTILTSVLYDYGVLATQAISMAVEGTLEGKLYEAGVPEGLGHLAPYYEMADAIPQEVQDRVAEITEMIRTGQIVIPSTEELSEVGSSENFDPNSFEQ